MSQPVPDLHYFTKVSTFDQLKKKIPSEKCMFIKLQIKVISLQHVPDLKLKMLFTKVVSIWSIKL